MDTANMIYFALPFEHATCFENKKIIYFALSVLTVYPCIHL